MDRSRAQVLPFVREHACADYLQPSAKPEDTYNIFNQVLPVRQILAPSQTEDWWHEDGAFPLPSLPMVAWRGSSFVLETAEQPDMMLILLHDGSANFTQSNHNLCLSAGDGLLVSGVSFRLDCQMDVTLGWCSGTALIIDTSLLMGEARSLAHHGWIETADTLPLQQAPWLISRHQTNHGHQTRNLILLDAIDRLIPSFAQLAFLHTNLLTKVVPIQSLMRMLCILVWDLAQASTSHPLDSTLRYIMANLGQALTLAQIEKISNYSSSGLQQAFRERCGCSPMKWVRLQRITLAHQRFLDPNLDVPIYQVAFDCGYRSVSRFNHDYKIVFGVSPSITIRKQRISLKSDRTLP